MLDFRAWNEQSNEYVGVVELYNIDEDDNHGMHPKNYSDDSGTAYGNVEDLSIELFSGLFSKDNLPIYVGDIIIKDKRKTRYEVIVNDFPTRGIYLKNIDSDYASKAGLRPGPACMSSQSVYEIVGNIHD